MRGDADCNGQIQLPDVVATLGGALISADVSPTTWVSEVIRADNLVGSVVGRRRTAELAFALPAVVALLLAAPALVRPADRRARAHVRQHSDLLED